MNNENITPSSLSTPAPRGGGKKILLILAVLLGVAAVAGSVAWGMQQNTSSKKAADELSTIKTENKKLSEELDKRKVTTGEENIDRSLFQAVFLKNGQVYFGKISKLTETQMTLENIYYLRTNSPVTNVEQIGGDVSLVKLGNELHGPQDTMYIERAEINFWENLKADGQVAKAIQEYEKQL